MWLYVGQYACLVCFDPVEIYIHVTVWLEWLWGSGGGMKRLVLLLRRPE